LAPIKKKETMCVLETVKPIWNSLEIVKIAVSFLTPLLIAVLAYWFNQRIKKWEKVQWTNQKIVEKRIELYDEMVPKLNDLFCFYCFIGNWKDITPEKVIALKRELDKKMYVYAPLFSKELLEKYNEFIEECFETFSGWGRDASIKSLFKRRKEFCKTWDDKWDTIFSQNYITSRKTDDNKVENDLRQIKSKYLSLLVEFKNSLEIYKTGIFHSSDTPNINFK
jgi:hypothetical protein